MISFRDGLDTLPQKLAKEIAEAPGCRVETGVRVRRVRAGEEGFSLDLDAGEIAARRVVLATPAEVTAELLDEATKGRSRPLAEIPYAPVVVAGVGARREDVGHPLDGFGFLAPRVESLRLLGCLFPSSIFPGRAPDGCVALSAFLGGRTDPQAVELSDEEVAALVREELGRALGLRGEPRVMVIRRWPRAIPQYELGHGRFVELSGEIERDLPQAQLSIDMVRMLQERTSGNLTPEESRFLAHVLRELQLNYVMELEEDKKATEKNAGGEGGDTPDGPGDPGPAAA